MGAFDTLLNTVLPQLCRLICSLGHISPPRPSPFSIINQITPTKLSSPPVIEIFPVFVSWSPLRLPPSAKAEDEDCSWGGGTLASG